MPHRIVPHASSAHRLACKKSHHPNSQALLDRLTLPGLSLYRALLKQSSALLVGGTNDESRAKAHVLTNLIHYRFRQDRSLRSPTQIINGLKAGYAALDLVHACNLSSSTALTRLNSLLATTASQAEYTVAYRAALATARSPTSPQKLDKVAHLRAVATKASFTRHPPSRPVLERPLPLSEIKGGKRRVPNLVSAQGVPFLRYSKPQPISLSRVIRQKVDRDQRMQDQLQEIKTNAVIARWEDEWDRTAEAHTRAEQGPAQGGGLMAPREVARVARTPRRGEESWMYELTIAEEEIYRQRKDIDRQNAEMGRKMWQIVVKERELAAQEKREAKIQRRIRYKAVAASKAREESAGV